MGKRFYTVGGAVPIRKSRGVYIWTKSISQKQVDAAKREYKRVFDQERAKIDRRAAAHPTLKPALRIVNSILVDTAFKKTFK